MEEPGRTDEIKVKKPILAAIAASLILSSALSAWMAMYKEEFFKFYHVHYSQSPEDTAENIYWLERAKKADFCNPLYALAKIATKDEWAKYRLLLDMHIDLKLIEQNLILGSKFDKMVAYFYNAPWKRENLESLKIAEEAYKTALHYWPEAVDLARQAQRYRFVYLPGVELWGDEAARIVSGDFNYAKIIDKQLTRLAGVRKDFEAMDALTY